MGATVDIESALEQALLYGHQGNFTERQNAINAAKENTVDFPLEIQVDEAAVKETLQEQAEQIYTPATDATVKTEKKSNEDALTTSLSIDYTEGVPGIEIDEMCIRDRV